MVKVFASTRTENASVALLAPSEATTVIVEVPTPPGVISRRPPTIFTSTDPSSLD